MAKIHFRPAGPEDALFIARGFHTAMLYEDVPEERILLFAEKICTRDDVLYSWKNTLLACDGDTPVGMLTAYDGRFYPTLRATTMQLIKELLGTVFEGMEDEASCGEYYLDSLAVIKDHRGRGIGRMLLQKGIEEGQRLGLKTTLAVDPVNERAQRLYHSLGFEQVGELFIFGHTYYKYGKQ